MAICLDKDLTDRMEPWRRSRLHDVAVDLGAILPIYSKGGAAFCRSALGAELGDIVPKFMIDVFMVSKNHKKETLIYLNWIKQACEYVLDENAERPIVMTHRPEEQDPDG